MERVTLEINNLINFTLAMELLQVSRPTIYKCIADNKLHPIAIGRSRFFFREEIMRLKQERENYGREHSPGSDKNPGD